MIVHDDELHVAPVDRLVEELDAFLEKIEMIASGNDDRYLQARQDCFFPAELVIAQLAVMSGLGEKRRCGPTASVRSVGQRLPGLFERRIGQLGFRREIARMMTDKRHVRDLVGAQFIPYA